MKILIANDSPFAHFFVRKAIASVMSVMGHETVIWDINQKSVYDAFDEFEPDLFIGQTYNLNRALIQCLSERPHVRVVMKASDWGPLSDKIDRDKYPVLIANKEEIENVKTLMDATGKPDVLYVHYDDHRLDETHGHWRELGLKVMSLKMAADVFEYTGGVFNPDFACDVGFLGGYWGYKAQTIDKYLIPLTKPESGVNVRIFGNQSWGIPSYCGKLAPGHGRNFLASATVCANVSELHSQDFGYDMIERPFKLLSNKCFVISDHVEDLKMLFPSQIVFAETPEQFHSEVRKWIKPEMADERQVIIDAGYAEVMDKHTYFHRVHDIFENLGMPDQQALTMEKFDLVKEKLKL